MKMMDSQSVQPKIPGGVAFGGVGRPHSSDQRHPQQLQLLGSKVKETTAGIEAGEGFQSLTEVVVLAGRFSVFAVFGGGVFKEQDGQPTDR